ncbi:MAG: TlpA family protein disulfide reductase [Tidjanibacter sp.]|nr:TlpA family protein disulfide reductase [Tidjanibacter sp.]
MKRENLIVLAAAMMGLCACSTDTANISGEFSACPEKSIYIEHIAADGSIAADSVVTNANGRFNIKVTLPAGEPTLYTLRCEERQIPLIISAGEKVVVNSVPGLIDGYTVSGSAESALVKEIRNIMTFGSAKLDSMITVYNETTSKAIQERINSDYAKEYFAIKRNQIEFIVTNPGSLAAIYALNQRLPGDQTLFNGSNDIVYYRLVADSVAKNYPNSPYVKSLSKAIEQYDQQLEVLNMFESAIEAGPAPFPELSLPDMYGKKHNLTDNLGKVFLIDFWSLGDQEANFRNAELKNIYNEYKDKGFEIYQISVDTSKPAWIETVQKQKLPWISVCDFLGTASPAVQLYNIQTIPQSFLVDKQGNIVARNAYGDNLRKELSKLLK